MSIIVGNIYAGLSGGGGGGGVLTLNNGLTLTGTNGQLGGALVVNTEIDINGFTFDIAGATVGFALDDTSGSASLTGTVGDSGFTNILTPTEISFLLQEPGARMGFDFDTFGDGMLVVDTILLAGMHYADDYSSQGIALYGDRWIPDVGYINAHFSNLPVVETWATENISATQVMSTYNTNPGDKSTVRVSVSLFADITAAGTVVTDVTFTDQDFNVVTINLGAPLVASGNAFYPPLTIQANSNTPVIVTTTVTGTGVNATSTGIIELLLQT